MTFTERMIGAATLDLRAYEEIEADPSANMQALAVVVLSSLAAGVGRGVGGLAIALIFFALLNWVIWAALAYAIGVYVLPEPETRADLGQMLRTLGFAASPGVLRIFAFVPVLGPLLSAVAAIWMLVTMVIAIRQALDYKGTMRAVGVCLIGWLVAVGAIAFFGSIFFISARSVLF